MPKTYYVQDSVKVQYDNSVTISRGSVFTLECDITTPSSLLRYLTSNFLVCSFGTITKPDASCYFLGLGFR